MEEQELYGVSSNGYCVVSLKILQISKIFLYNKVFKATVIYCNYEKCEHMEKILLFFYVKKNVLEKPQTKVNYTRFIHSFNDSTHTLKIRIIMNKLNNIPLTQMHIQLKRFDIQQTCLLSLPYPIRFVQMFHLS